MQKSGDWALNNGDIIILSPIKWMPFEEFPGAYSYKENGRNIYWINECFIFSNEVLGINYDDPVLPEVEALLLNGVIENYGELYGQDLAFWAQNNHKLYQFYYVLRQWCDENDYILIHYDGRRGEKDLKKRINLSNPNKKIFVLDVTD